MTNTKQETLKAALAQIIENLSNNDLIALHNETCVNNDDNENEISLMDEIEDRYDFTGKDLITILDDLELVNISDKYLAYNEYGWLQSYNDLKEITYVSDMVNALIEYNMITDNAEINEFLKKNNLK